MSKYASSAFLQNVGVAIFAAIRRASSSVSSLPLNRPPGSLSARSQSCDDVGVVSGGFDFRFLMIAVLFGVGRGSTATFLTAAF
jgi:hypothetical protein